MKFILFNINDTNNNTVSKIQLDETHYINEVSLSKNILEFLDKAPKNIIKKIKRTIKERDIEKKIFKALGPYDKKWYYILSNNMEYLKYVENKAQSMLGFKLNATNELDSNIFKYVDEYLINNNSLKKHDLKVLVVANYSKNINIKLIESLIKEYKTVNVYLKDKPSSYILKTIKAINKNEGTTIDIIKNERKVFKEYNVIYFIDDIKENFPRFRLDKNALVLDMSLIGVDKFNSNLMFMNNFIKEKKVHIENIERILTQYNELRVATAISKIIK